MEKEILDLLKEIRGVLWLMLYALGVGVFFWVVKSCSITINQLQQSLNDKWKNDAIKFFDTEEYDSLINHCNNKLKKAPNDCHAKWWLARSYKELGKNEKALKLFEEIAEIEPSWKKESIIPYVKKINQSIKAANKSSNSDAINSADS